MLAAAPVAAVCEPSGAFDVATHDEVPGAIILWDSVGSLWESPDDTQSWYLTDRLPLGAARSADEVCLGDGRCLRIAGDGLGIERSTAGGWEPLWAYPSERLDFLERQTPGPCGEGHGRLGLEALVGGPSGSRFDVLVAAGSDGLFGIEGDDVTTGLYGTSASLSASIPDIYLAPEVVGVLLVGLGLGLWLNLFRGGEDARTLALVMAVTSIGAVTVVVLPRVGQRGFEFVLGAAAVVGVGLWLLSRRRHFDVAEVIVGIVWAVGAGFVPQAMHASHEAVVFAYTLGGVSSILLLGSWWAGRERAGARGSSGLWVLAVSAAGVGLGAYLAWAGSLIESKQVADAIAVSAVVGSLVWAVSASRGLERQ